MRCWLKKIRIKNKKTQAQVAREANISQNYYSCIETGERGKKLPVATAKAIAAVLGFEWTLLYEERKSVNDT